MTLPNLDLQAFRTPDYDKLLAPLLTYKPRILLLYGSLRERSYSRFLTLEAQRLLEFMGGRNTDISCRWPAIARRQHY